MPIIQCAGIGVRLIANEERIVSLASELFSKQFILNEADVLNNLIWAGKLSIQPNGAELWSLSGDIKEQTNLDIPQLAKALCAAVQNLFVEKYTEGLAVSGGLVTGNDAGIVVIGTSKADRALLCAWLNQQHFDVQSDARVFFGKEGVCIDSLYQSISVKTTESSMLDELGLQQLSTIKNERTHDEDQSVHFYTPLQHRDHINETQDNVLLFSDFQAGANLRVQPLSSAESIMALASAVLNAQKLPGMGFAEISRIAKKIPAVRVTFGDFSQLNDVLDPLLIILAKKTVSTKLLSALGVGQEQVIAEPETEPAAIINPEEVVATPVSKAHQGKKLTIAMATYDDFDGVYFSVQALRLFHPEVVDDIELLVIDNNPLGKCGAALRNLAKKIPNMRYIPEIKRSGSAVKGRCFEEASSDFVMCIDCHVLITPGAIKRLINYYAKNPECIDILQGPMLDDRLTGGVSTHFEPKWNKGMFGVWGTDQRGKGIENESFDIMMQGMGLFSCRKAAWPGFNPGFRGFGGEEGYIHEKFRLAGGQALCLPFLRWLHRFERPLGVPYRVAWDDRVMNYLYAFNEVGWDQEEMLAHFSDHVSQELVDRCLKQFEAENKTNK